MTSERRGGPFVRGAFFCERVLQEKDGVNTYVRVIDRVTHHVPRAAGGGEAPEALEPFHYETNFVVMTTAGDSIGRSVARFEMEEPSGLRKPLTPPIDISWQRPNQGQTVHLGLRMELKYEGVYWVRVLIDDNLVTQAPLEVIYSRMPPPSSV